MILHRELGLPDETLLKDVVCPSCHSPQSLYLRKVDQPNTIEPTVICDVCGISFSKLTIDTRTGNVLKGEANGHWTCDMIPELHVDGVHMKEGDPYFKSIAEPVTFGPQISGNLPNDSYTKKKCCF